MSYYVHPLDLPDLLNIEALHEFIVKDVGMKQITLTRVRDAVREKKLVATKVSGSNCFTRRNALAWLESIGIAVDWASSTIAAKRDVAAKELAEADAALEMMA